MILAIARLANERQAKYHQPQEHIIPPETMYEVIISLYKNKGNYNAHIWSFPKSFRIIGGCITSKGASKGLLMKERCTN